MTNNSIHSSLLYSEFTVCSKIIGGS